MNDDDVIIILTNSRVIHNENKTKKHVGTSANLRSTHISPWILGLGNEIDLKLCQRQRITET